MSPLTTEGLIEDMRRFRSDKMALVGLVGSMGAETETAAPGLSGGAGGAQAADEGERPDLGATETEATPLRIECSLTEAPGAVGEPGASAVTSHPDVRVCVT